MSESVLSAVLSVVIAIVSGVLVPWGAIRMMMKAHTPRPAAAVLLTQGQVRSVQAARSALAAGDHRQALTVLNGLLAARGPDF